MRKRRLLLLSLSFAAVSLVAIAIVWLNVGNPNLTERDHIEQIRSELISQIQNYDSEARTHESSTDSRVSSNDKESRSPSVLPAQLSTNDPYYSTVSAVSEMTIERLADRSNPHSSQLTGEPRQIDWLEDPSGS